MDITLTITALSHAGEGIGRLDGRAIFVPFALPGETVRAEIVAEKKTFARARLLEVLQASPDRIAPPCPHHFQLPAAGPACGGCQLQHLAYPAQLLFKQRLVVEQLTRLGGMKNPPVLPCLPAAQEFGYRNHVQFSLTQAGQLGFQAAGSNQVTPIRECRQLLPVLAELWPRLSIDPEYVPELEAVALRAGDNDLLVALQTEAELPEMDIDLSASVVGLSAEGVITVLAGSDHITATVRGRSFVVSAGSFFQINSAQAQNLVELVLAALDLHGGETVLDLYCGVGLLTAFIAPLAGRVIGVEAYLPAVEDAAENLDEFDNVEIYAAPVEEVLPTLDLAVEALVLDPPRSGCAPAAAAWLAAHGPARLVYVSCDPATLARDARQLLAGGYTLVSAQPLDMFPQTHHVECVALFERPSNLRPVSP